MSVAETEREIAALLRERASRVQRGQDDHVALIDKELKARGYKPDKDEEPKARTTRQDKQQTTVQKRPAEKTVAKKATKKTGSS